MEEIRTRLRESGLVSKKGGPGVASVKKWGTDRLILQATTKPWLELEQTATELAGGLQVGDFWPFHGGGYRLCKAEQALTPGRATYWSGAEEGRASSSTAKTLIPASVGDDKITLETEGNFDANAFTGGLLRITGGASGVAGRYYNIAYNKKSRLTTEISGLASKYATDIYIAGHFDTALDIDTDWHIQGNPFDCQRHSPSTEDTDQPRLTIGIPRVAVASGDYFWNQVSGPAVGQLQASIDATDAISAEVDLMLWPGVDGRTTANLADVGKLVPIDQNSDIPSQVFARLNVRKETAFAADAFVPIWLYGNVGV